MNWYYYFEQTMFFIVGIVSTLLHLLLFNAQKYHASKIGRIHQKFHRIGFVMGCLITGMAFDPRGLHGLYHYSIIYFYRDGLNTLLGFAGVIWFEVVLSVFYSSVSLKPASDIKWLKWFFVGTIGITGVITNILCFVEGKRWYRGIPGVLTAVFAFIIFFICMSAVVVIHRQWKSPRQAVGSSASKSMYSAAFWKLSISAIAFLVLGILLVIQSISTMRKKKDRPDAIIPNPNERDPYGLAPMYLCAVLTVLWVSWIPLTPSREKANTLGGSAASKEVRGKPESSAAFSKTRATMAISRVSKMEGAANSRIEEGVDEERILSTSVPKSPTGGTSAQTPPDSPIGSGGSV